jgi:uridine kinase
MKRFTSKERTAQIIAICGGSGSGKSTLAHKFVGAALLATDSFYRDLPDLIAREDGSYDFDHPSAVDIEGCAEACQALAAGQDVVIPVYDMRTWRRVGTQVVPAPPNKIVVVEGIFAFHSPLAEVATLKIFIDTPVDQRMARRLRRDVERGRNTLETIRHSLEVEEAYTRYVEPMRQRADLILMGEEMRGGWEAPLPRS